MRVTTFISAVLFISLLSSISYSADTVMSADVKEADGSSGQNTNSGSGIKTGHIQNDAVTGAKIANSAIGSAKIANGAVTNAKIAAGAVGTMKLADGAVTPSKIGFYHNVIIVDINGGGDFTSPADALNSITDATTSKPYLVKIMPGVYDLGTGFIQMKPYVDLEGFGENVTIIKGSISATLGLLRLADYSDVRHITLRHTASSGSAAAIYALDVANAKAMHITIYVQGGTNNYGIYASNSTVSFRDVFSSAIGGTNAYGLRSNNSYIDMIDAVVQGYSAFSSNYGVYNYMSDLTLTDAKVYAQSGLYSKGIYQYQGNLKIFNAIIAGTSASNINYGIETSASTSPGSMRIHDSFLRGTTNTVKASISGSSDQTTLIFNTQLYGGPVTTSDSSTGSIIMKCINAYDESFVFSTSESCF